MGSSVLSVVVELVALLMKVKIVSRKGLVVFVALLPLLEMMSMVGLVLVLRWVLILFEVLILERGRYWLW